MWDIPYSVSSCNAETHYATETCNHHDRFLQVRDNGIGIKEDLKDKKHHSFGYRMIRAFAEKLEAKLTVEVENGTVVSLLIPAVNINIHE